MDIVLTRSLNGVNITHDEMKSYVFKSEVFAKVLADVNKRINFPQDISPKDKSTETR